MGQAKRRILKQQLLERDGWQDEDGIWWVTCAFGCGDLLDFRHATIDRFPVPGREGGCYVLSNCRLACGPCNSEDGGNYQRAVSGGGGVGSYLPPMKREVGEMIPKEQRERLLKKAQYKQQASQTYEGIGNMHGIRMDFH